MQQAWATGANSHIVQILGDGNTVLAGHPHLRLTRYLTRRSAVEETGGAAAALLSPYSLAVPLVGRGAVLGELWDWLASSRPISVRVVTARAGTGKTRLALELCDQAVAAGWGAGFLTADELVRFRAQQNLSTWGWNRPTLVVVDYAGLRAGLLHHWLVELADHEGHDGKPLRLLLLERHADPAGGWWREAFGLGGGDAEAVARLLDPPSGPYALAALGGVSERRRVLASILERVGSRLQLPAATQAADIERRLGEISWGGEPLFLLMAGLVAAKAGFADVLALSAPDLGRHIALREIQRLHEIARSRGLPEALLAHLAAYITLCQGLSVVEVEAAIEEETEALRYAATGNPPDVAQALAMALPGDPGAISPILPDVVGEAVVLAALGGGEGDPRGDKALAAVLRAAHRAPDPVAASLVHLAQDYGAVRPEPLRWFARMAEARTVDFDALVALLDQLPTDTLVLGEAAAALTARAVELARSRKDNEALAHHLNNLSCRLSDLGRREDALAASQEAVAIRREIAAAQPAAFRPDLALALNNLSKCLSELGQTDAAFTTCRESVELYSELAAARPDIFSADLARALNNLSIRLSDFGRSEDALVAGQAATQLYRELAAAEPDAFRPGLATALLTLAVRLKDLGQREAALKACEEAVAIRRELAAARPDAFRPDLARALNNLSGCLSLLGQAEDALATCEEAVAIRRELAAARPDAFSPGLAQSLQNLSSYFSDLGRREAALTAGQEAVQLFGELAAARPDAFRPHLASALINLAGAFSHLGQPEAALAACQEAVQLHRELAAQRPEAFRPTLAAALHNVAGCLSALGQREAALAASEEVTQLYRELAAARPDAFCPRLAMALSNLCAFLSDLGRSEAALAAAEEAVQLCRELAAARPEVFRPDLAMALNNLSNSRSALGQGAGDMAAGQEAVHLYRELAAAMPDVYLSELAMALGTLSSRFHEVGQLESALAAGQEAAHLYRDLAGPRPDAFRPKLAMALKDLSIYLGDLGRHEEGFGCSEEAVRTLSPHFLTHPAVFGARMKRVLARYLECAEAAGAAADGELVAPVLAVLLGLR